MSLTFVIALDAGFIGVAYGTLCANWIGFILSLICVARFRRRKRMFCRLRDALRGGEMMKFFSVNVNLFIRSACIICVSMGVASAGARLGTMTLAINVIVMQLFQFFSFFMDGLAFSAEAMVGRYAGARDGGNLTLTVRSLLKWTSLVSLVFTLFYAFGCGEIASLLTDQKEVAGGVADLRVLVALIPLLSAWAFIYDGFYVGITKTGKMMQATLASTIVFYIIAFLHYKDGVMSIGVVNNVELWSAFVSYLALRGVLLAIMWKKSLKI